MAANPNDPITITGESVEHAKAYSVAVADSAAATQVLSNNASAATPNIGALSEGIGAVWSGAGELIKKALGAADSIRSMSTATERQTTVFAGLTTAALGAGRSLDGITGKFDMKGVNDISSQWKGLTEILKNSPGGEVAKKIAGTVGGIFTSMGMGSQAAKDGLNGVMGGIIKFGDAVLTGTGEVQKLKAAQFQAAAQTGDLGKMMNSVKPDLSNFNQVLLGNIPIMTEAGRQTSIGGAALQDYYGQLLQVPGALNAQVSGLSNASAKTNMLTASINFATGTGRKFDDIMKDLTETYNAFGVAGEGALAMQSKFSEISANTGAPLEMVRTGLKATAASFDNVADSGKSAEAQFSGLADVTNRYFQSLKNQGMSNNDAFATITSMTKAVQGLNTAQKSFLSQQTGGPGGLMGAFQIENMLRDGKTKEVFDKYREAMMKQMGGTIVTRQEAGQSEAAASQFQKQRMMLTKGPLGGMVSDERDADRLLESFSKNDSSSFKPLEGNSLQKQMKLGQDIGEATKSPVQDMINALETAQLNANITNFGALEKAVALRPNSPMNGNETEAAARMRQNMIDQRNSPAPTNMLGSMKDLLRVVDNLPSSVKGVVSGLVGAVKGGKVEDVQKQRDMLQDNVNQARARNRVTDETRAQQVALQALDSATPRAERIKTAPRNTATEQKERDKNNVNPNNPGGINPPQKVIVESHVTGICIECGKKSKGSAQARSTAPAAFPGDE